MFSASLPITVWLWANIQPVTLPETIRPPLFSHLIINSGCVYNTSRPHLIFIIIKNCPPSHTHTHTFPHARIKLWNYDPVLQNNQDPLFFFSVSLHYPSHPRVSSARLCNIQASVAVITHLLILVRPSGEHTCMLMGRDCTTARCGQPRRWGDVTEEWECLPPWLPCLPDWLPGTGFWKMPTQSLIFAPT